MEKSLKDKIMWKIVSSAAAFLAAIAVRSILTKSWKAIKHNDPPENPESADTDWTEAILWAMATAMTAGLARVLAQRGAVAGWRKVTGETPPV
ncbi:hypothetical protein BH23BAC1_BH23BAC1_26670 [soil metagenome]